MGRTRTGKSKQSSGVKKCNQPSEAPIEKITKNGTLLDLPSELLGLIFRKYLTTPDRKALRLANSVIQVFVDQYVGYDATVDENDSKSKFKFLSEVVLKSITFYNLTQLKRPKAVKVPTFQEMFSFPQCLREVHIELELNAGIFNAIVRNCPTLEVFSSSLVSSLHSDSLPTSSLKQVILPEVSLNTLEPFKNRNFPKLHSLRMMFKETLDKVQRKLSCEAVLVLMKSVQSAFLDCVILQLNMCDSFSIADATHAAAVCLERNPNITKFFFGILNQVEASRVEDTQFAEDLEKNTLELFKKAGKCTRLSRCGIGTDGAYSFGMWKTFFNSCANLIHMSFTLTSQQGPFTREWFSNSKDTLQQLIYRGDFADPFDFECIQDCHNLREICLHNIHVEEENTQVVADDIRNLHFIPTSVKSLILFQTVCRTDEIIGVVNRLSQLETLALYKLGHSGEAGINIACIRKILGLRKLKSLLLLRFVASSTVEADELVQILQLMGTVTREDPPFQEIVVVETDSSDNEDDYVPVVNNNFRRLQRNNFIQLRQQFNDRLRLLDGDADISSEEWDDDDDDFDAYSESEESEIVNQQANCSAPEGNDSSKADANAYSEDLIAGDQLDEKDVCIIGAERSVGRQGGLDGKVDEELLGACGGVSPALDTLTGLKESTSSPVVPSSLPVVTDAQAESEIGDLEQISLVTVVGSTAVGGDNIVQITTVQDVTPKMPTKPEDSVCPIEVWRPAEPFESVKPVGKFEAVRTVEAIRCIGTVEAVNPVDPVKCVDPVKPIEPVKCVDPVKPIEPVNCVDPVKPIEPVKCVDPVKPNEPGKCVVPVEPGKCVVPVEPGKCVDPVEPGKCVDTIAAVNPVDPVEPVNPVDPVEPVNPVDPVEPVNPVYPVEPVNPVDPVEPVNPVDPVEPVNPVDTVEHVNPVDPVEPLNPVDPVEPARHIDHVDPVRPIEPAMPVNHIRFNHPERAIEAEVDEAVAALDQFIEENRDNFRLMVNLQNEGELRDILDVLQPVQEEDNNILFGFILEAVIDISDDETSTTNEYGKWKAIMNPDTGDLTYELKLNCFIG